MPASPIRKLVPYADGAKKRGTKVYHLNIGQPDLETPKAFWDKLAHLDMKVLEYCPSDGIASYREKFSEYYNRLGIKVNPSNFIITNGGSEALLFTMMSCIDVCQLHRFRHQWQYQGKTYLLPHRRWFRAPAYLRI